MRGQNDPERIVQLTDWLPPEFSAVSQYVTRIGEREAAAGKHVTTVGLRSETAQARTQRIGEGSLTILPIFRRRYAKQDWPRRLLWSLSTNLLLIAKAWRYLRRCDTIRFTGSPPFLLHFVFAANLLLRKRLVYRITDFYPECIIAALDRPSLLLEAMRRFTNFVRRRVDRFEALGEDMRRRLIECGVPAHRILLSRDDSPVLIGPGTPVLPLPPALNGKRSLLYSGNLGVAHDIDTFLAGYRRHHQEGEGSVILWLNATGSGADALDSRLRASGLPFHRQTLVPIDALARLLVTPDAHLVTLRANYMGYVLPSKIYGCIASGKPILFIGPAGSDVHQLSLDGAADRYRRIEIGDSGAVKAALDALGEGSRSFDSRVTAARPPDHPPIDQPTENPS